MDQKQRNTTDGDMTRQELAKMLDTKFADFEKTIAKRLDTDRMNLSMRFSEELPTMIDTVETSFHKSIDMYTEVVKNNVDRQFGV